MENKNKMLLTNDERIVLSYLELLNHLSVDLKLKLISKLTESMTFELEKTTPEPPAWKSLFGAWKDMDENLADDIRAARLSQREIPSLDL